MPPSQLLLAFICIYESMYKDGKGKDLLMVFFRVTHAFVYARMSTVH